MNIFKNKFSVLTLAVATLALGACSTCPTVDSHTGQFPYSNMRTAGTATAVYGGKCKVAEPVMVQETVAEEPAPVVIKSAEPVFTKKQTK